METIDWNDFEKVELRVGTIVEVEDYLYATSQLSQTTLRSVLGQVELDELLAERDKINKRLQDVLDKQSDPWVTGRVAKASLASLASPPCTRIASVKVVKSPRCPYGAELPASHSFSFWLRPTVASNLPSGL